MEEHKYYSSGIATAINFPNFSMSLVSTMFVYIHHCLFFQKHSTFSRAQQTFIRLLPSHLTLQILLFNHGFLETAFLESSGNKSSVQLCHRQTFQSQRYTCTLTQLHIHNYSALYAWPHSKSCKLQYLKTHSCLKFFWECLVGCNSKWSKHEGNTAKISSIFSISSPFLQGIFLMLSSAKQDCMDFYLFENPARNFPLALSPKNYLHTGSFMFLWAHKKV